jgi:SAM-dependent methyltransferase
MDFEEIVPRVSRDIMQGDHMCPDTNYKHYFYVGSSALSVISAALILGNNPKIESVLDFACGSGRVTRWLKAGFPNAQVVASDLREDSLQFIQKHLGAECWLSSEDISMLEPPAKFDLIWCGSLLTHLSEKNSTEVINKLSDWLNPAGVAVFSTHGRGVISRNIDGVQKSLNDETFSEVVESMKNAGYGYADYPGRDGIGFSLSKLEWVTQLISKLPDVRVLMAGECLWANHQDVVAIQKRSIHDYRHDYSNIPEHLKVRLIA